MDAGKFCELLNGAMVDIYVGQERIHYHLSLKLLSHHSSYFDKAFNGGFKEGATKRLDLPDEDIHAFNLLIQWIYSGQVNTPKHTEAATVDGGDLVPAPWPQTSTYNPANGKQKFEIQALYPIDYNSHLKLYVLADRFDMGTLKNETIYAIMRAGYSTKRAIIREWGPAPYPASYMRFNPSYTRFNPETIAWIYENTLPGSPLRKLASTSAAYTMLLKKVTAGHYMECLHGDFIVDMLNAMQENADNAILCRLPNLGAQCKNYHDHEGKTPRPGCAEGMPGVDQLEKGMPSADKLYHLSPVAKCVFLELNARRNPPESVTAQQLASRSSFGYLGN
ncbi:MAG: hypothetical protein FRX48_08219 [Lasallia pustulata]|uniref:BTB domain-containing protein n=1 Tax=Lasallia pustulata TaxID=136370 RepID=A0A5M8PG07_9LECA|nr:MAG: hypothetical protein FRX48_08219 [Lasallia pustulata]